MENETAKETQSNANEIQAKSCCSEKEENKEGKGCCSGKEANKENKNNKNNNKTPVKQGILYGLMPHAGCIAFIAASVLGATAAVELFKPLLMNAWFFYALIVMSFVFATISSALYLRKNGILSRAGALRKKGYLATMYGTTIGINLALFLLVFPMLANLDTGVLANAPATAQLSATPAPGTIAATPAAPAFSTIKLQVEIPCSGHAPLISGELKKIEGVSGVRFDSPNYFEVAFDPLKTSEQKILALEVFQTYKATVVERPAAISASLAGGGALAQNAPTPSPQPTQKSVSTAASGCGCGGSGGGCGGSGGSCGGCGGTASQATGGTTQASGSVTPSCHATQAP
ncbi:MAG: hypothetical protein V1493_06490 [Candidatus Diapherotrites archaeon]